MTMFKNRLEATRLLINRDVNIDAFSSDVETSTYYAIGCNDLPVAKELL